MLLSKNISDGLSLRDELENTAELLNIFISGEQEENILHAFERLLEYFSVMNTAAANLMDADEDSFSPHGVLRGKTAHSFPDTHALIERSGGHEHNYILIPNVLSRERR